MWYGKEHSTQVRKRPSSGSSFEHAMHSFTGMVNWQTKTVNTCCSWVTQTSSFVMTVAGESHAVPWRRSVSVMRYLGRS